MGPVRLVPVAVLTCVMASNAQVAAQSNAPRIESLSPSSAVAGGATGLTLTVSGEGFGNAGQGVVVRWNGLDRPTTYVNPGQLLMPLSARDLAQAGTAQVTVFLPLGRGTVSAPAAFTIENPRPTISSLSPQVAAAGVKTNVALSVMGSAFAAGAQVHWNGAPRNTTRTSSTVLTAALSSSDLATPGTYNVTVVNPAPGGGPSAGLSFRVVAVPAITAFHIGGPNDPARVWAGQAVPLHATSTGSSPTHWRAAATASALQSTAWQSVGTMNHTFAAWRTNDCGVTDPSTYRRQHDLHFQFATVIGQDTLSSAARSDQVIVRLPWCSPVRIYTPLAYGGFPSGTLQYALCPVGQVMTGFRARVYSVAIYGDIVTAIGPVCNGTDRPLVGTTDGVIRRTDFGSGGVPALMVLPGSVQTLKGVLGLPVGSPTWLGTARTYDPLYAVPAGGTVSGGGSGGSWDVRCATNAVPIGMGIYRNGPQGPSIGVGLVCVRPD